MTQLNTIDDCVPYSGWPDGSLYDAKNLAMHAVIAGHISRDPALLDKARKNLRRKLAGPGRAGPQVLIQTR